MRYYSLLLFAIEILHVRIMHVIVIVTFMLFSSISNLGMLIYINVYDILLGASN